MWRRLTDKIAEALSVKLCPKEAVQYDVVNVALQMFFSLYIFSICTSINF